MDIASYMQGVGRQARAAARVLARATPRPRTARSRAWPRRSSATPRLLVRPTREDIAAARAAGLDPALLDRLALTAKGIDVDGRRPGADRRASPDPIGEITDLRDRPTGIRVGRMRVPLGVIGIIYESRPNVTADAAGLCLKVGQRRDPARRLARRSTPTRRSPPACTRGSTRRGLPDDAVQVVATTDRAAVGELLTHERVRRHHRAARRQGPDRAHHRTNRASR